MLLFYIIARAHILSEDAKNLHLSFFETDINLTLSKTIEIYNLIELIDIKKSL